jgi:hypothetical protein
LRLGIPGSRSMRSASANSHAAASRNCSSRYLSRLHQSALLRACACRRRGARRAWAGLAASCARPSLAGAAGGSAVRGDASVWGHVQRGFIFPILPLWYSEPGPFPRASSPLPSPISEGGQHVSMLHNLI